MFYDDGSFYSFSARTIREIQRASTHIAATGNICFDLADIFLFITFVELATGFMLALRGGQPGTVRKAGRIAILSWSVLLFALAIALFGLVHAYAVKYLGASSDSSREYLSLAASEARDSLTINRLQGAFMILMWITSIPMVAFASIVVHKARKNDFLRSVRSPVLSLSPPLSKRHTNAFVSCHRPPSSSSS